MLSDNTKFGIFYGFIILWTVWGIVSYFFDYAFQIYLSLMILGLMVWIGIVVWRMRTIVLPGGSVRIMNHRIP